MPPAYLSPSPPVPEARAASRSAPPGVKNSGSIPTRYGDWEKKGIAVDF